MPDAFDHCEALVREADKDRFLASLFAPAKHRRALYALYAFDLELWRVREAAREPMPGEIRLQFWRDVLGGAQSEGGSHPVGEALRAMIVRYGLPPQALGDMIDAHAFDLYDDPMAALADLEAYATRTSGVPIALAARILNDGRDAGIDDLARHAGIARSIAILLRALPRHAARRQLYLPMQVLTRHRAQSEDVFAACATVEVRAALAELRLHARAHLDAARHLAGAMPQAAAPALLPVALVRLALRAMERGDPFHPAEVASWRRQWTLWRAARRGLHKSL